MVASLHLTPPAVEDHKEKSELIPNNRKTATKLTMMLRNLPALCTWIILAAAGSFLAHGATADDLVFTNCNQNPCNQILQEFDRDEITNITKQIFQNLLGSVYPTIEQKLNNMLQYGVQVYKICASCSEYNHYNEGNDCHEEFCGLNAYGYNATVSGLLFVPTGMPQQPNVLKAGIWSHPTAAHTCNDIPSEGSWSRFQARHFNINIMVPLLTATSGNVALAPDNLGYGASYDYHIGYIIRRQYQTSAIPLWYKAQEMVRGMINNCSMQLGNSAFVAGYSEGGYGAIAIAEALDNCLGVSVSKVMAGAGPIQTTRSFMEITHNIDIQEFPARRLEYLVLIGASYAHWYPDHALLGNEWHNKIMNLTTVGSSGRTMRKAIPTYPDDPFQINAPALMDEYRSLLSTEGFGFCFNDTISKSVEGTYFCQAIRQNDLTNYLLSNEVDYELEVCHSRNDEVIPISNAVPLFQENYWLESFGNHDDAATPCVSYILDYLIDPDFVYAQVDEDKACLTNTGESPLTVSSTREASSGSTVFAANKQNYVGLLRAVFTTSIMFLF